MRIVIGNETGTRPDRPENAPNTKCWIGPKAFEAARKSCKCDGVLWGKQGNGNGSNPGGGTDSDPGPGFNPNNGNTPFETAGGDFNYFAFIPGRGYGGMNHGAGPGQMGYFTRNRPANSNNQSGQPYNTEMWCCTKK